MDALVEVVELHAVYGFMTPIVIDLESVDSEWLDEHCDVVGFARSRAEIPAGLWLARGCVAEVTETRLVARRDERAVRTISGPIVVRFTRAGSAVPSIKWEWANVGDCPFARLETAMGEHRDGTERDPGTDLAHQAAGRGVPICHGATYTPNLDVELANQAGPQHNSNRCEDLASSTLANGPHSHE
jgi:hypothetical protein